MQKENCENKKSGIFKRSEIFNLKNFNKALALAIIILSVYYVAGMNDLAIKGFALSELKQQKNKLTEANNKLELDAMSISSYGKISERVAGLKMVAVGQVNYINASADSVAKR